jgi:hypothetical protein
MYARTPQWLSAAAIAGVLALGGCGGSSDSSGSGNAGPTVDAAAVEEGITEQLSKTGDVSSVECPANVPWTPGVTLDCDVTLKNGATGTFNATQQGAKRYDLSLVSGSVKIPGAVAVQSVEKSLAEQGYPNAQVTCPETIPVKVGTTTTCDVTGAGGAASGKVTFTFSSASGTVDSSSVQVA